MARSLLRRLGAGLAILLVITFLSFLAQGLAVRTQVAAPAPLGDMLRQAVQQTLRFWADLPRGQIGAYRVRGGWSSFSAPFTQVLGGLLLNSVALLLVAMSVGGLVGGLIGVLAAAARKPRASLALILCSIVGISTPSFFLGMLLQYLEIVIYRNTGLRLVPVGGFGWDNHMILPILVLAARPGAQVARLTYVRVSGILEEDFVRTARAKGLAPWHVWAGHILPNAASSVLTAIGTSLRFSLSSLPVVEFLFGWPGAGAALLDMLRTFQASQATALVMALGALFIGVNILLDVLFHVIDPRLSETEAALQKRMPWGEWLLSLLEGCWATITLRGWRERRRAASSAAGVASLAEWASRLPSAPVEEARDLAERRKARRHAWRQATAGNPALILGAAIGIGLLVLTIAGPAWAPHNAYVSATRLMIDGVAVTPPVAPTPLYPLGTDAQGRDILSLLLVGARRTLMIALLAVAARLIIGGALGFLAGWFAGSQLDRTIMGLAEIIGAFPALLLAMLIVYAVGVRQGMNAFIIALAGIGWGEVMQTVRTQVLSIRPMAYIEGAVSVGVPEGRMLSAHVLPNVWPTMVSLAFLEMGGVLMILGELGFLGVFIGGGLAASGDNGLPNLIYYDIPEWSVMLANSWRTFRSVPWAALFPALAFFISILGFTFLGEGLRRMTERLTLSLRTLFNRYTLAVAVVIILGARWMFQSTGFYARYTPAANAFSATRALQDVRYLASDALGGRLSGAKEADQTAQWIAEQLDGLGLQRGGEGDTFFQTFSEHYRDLTAQPTLVLSGPQGERIEARYGVDFIREYGPKDAGGIGKGEITFVVQGSDFYWTADQVAMSLGISPEEAARTDRLLLRLWSDSAEQYQTIGRSGLLTLAEHPFTDERYQLLATSSQVAGQEVPSVLISRELVERILASIGHSISELKAQIDKKEMPAKALYLPTGWTATLSVPAQTRDSVAVRNVIGVWPGEDMLLDSEAIIVTAYYDGLGRTLDGTLYPGANDNASGVATLIESIRTLKEQGFHPKRTLIFVAWVGGERRRAVDYPYFLKAHLGFADAYKIVAGLELEGVGAGSGSAAVIWHTSRERVTQVVQKAAQSVHTPLSVREQGLHADPAWPLPAGTVPAAVLSWAGSDATAHLPSDAPDTIDPAKVGKVGRMLSLALMVLAMDPAY